MFGIEDMSVPNRIAFSVSRLRGLWSTSIGARAIRQT